MGKGSSSSGIESLTDLVLKTEKLEGKFDVVSGYKDDLNQRMAQISEEIGELRGMVLETDHSFGKVEKDFQEIKEVVGDVEPLRVKKQFEKKEQEIMENVVKIEKIEKLIDALEKESAEFRKTMDKIKSFDNLVDISKKINEKISQIEDTKKYSDRTAAKIQTIFSEITDKVNELQSQKEKINKLDELTTEITQMLDEVTIKMKDLTDSKDFKSFRKEIEGQIKEIAGDKDKIDKVARLIDETNAEKSLGEIKKVSKEINQVKNRIDDFNSEFEKKSKTLKSLGEKISQIEDTKKHSDRTAAKIQTIFSEITDKVNELQVREERLSGLVNSISENNVKKNLVKTKEMLDEMGDLEKKLNHFNSVINRKTRQVDHNKDRIEEIEKRLIPEINNLKEKMSEVRKIPPLSQEMVNKLSKIDEYSPKIEKIKKIIEKQNNVISDLINGMEKVRNIPEIDVKELNNIGLSLRFYQLLSILPFLEDRVKLKEYSKEMKGIIRKMKESGVWGEKEEKFMEDLLKVSKKISVPTNQDEVLDKMNKLTSWTSTITDEIQEIRKRNTDLKGGLDIVKKSLQGKVDSNDIEDVYIVERELMELTGRFNKLKSVTERQNVIVDDVLEKVRKFESEEIIGLKEGLNRLRSVVERQNFIINDLVMEIKDKDSGINKELIDEVKTTTRFYQLLNMLPYIIEPTRVKAYLMELKQLIGLLKSNENWDPEKERFMKNFLSSLSDNYKSRGYEEIGSAYGEII